MKLDQYSLLKEKLNSDKYSSIFILVDDNTDEFCLDIFKEKSGVKRFNKIIIKSGLFFVKKFENALIPK